MVASFEATVSSSMKWDNNSAYMALADLRSEVSEAWPTASGQAMLGFVIIHI